MTTQPSDSCWQIDTSVPGLSSFLPFSVCPGRTCLAAGGYGAAGSPQGHSYHSQSVSRRGQRSTPPHLLSLVLFLWGPVGASEFLPDPDASGLLGRRPEVRVSAQAAACGSRAFKRGVQGPLVPRRRGRQQITTPLILTCPKGRMKTALAPMVNIGK